MAVIKNKEVIKMNNDEKKKKLEELKMELIKKNVHANKSGKIRTKEIKKAIARILTSMNSPNKMKLTNK
ncbi:50S ribosomal protein L29 [Candidatus Pacearchaeota archaeon CG10_big_fil_rev_8_21_14_0_10_35_13]|nr:MAG: 50S ribosomal protein L29 [Candidatus Pacearchaeota archaeon CG10_big_fil_rev_8_21_14_0_10_35_13]